MEKERSLKDQAFWFCVSFAFVTGLVLAAGVVSMRQCPKVEPTTYRLEIVTPRAAVFDTPLDIAFFPLRFGKTREGKRSEPGEKLAPETIAAFPVREGRDPFERLK